jgi:hypothetical protein
MELFHTQGNEKYPTLSHITHCTTYHRGAANGGFCRGQGWRTECSAEKSAPNHGSLKSFLCQLPL